MKKKIKSKKQQLFDSCERLWKQCVRERAEHRSELSGNNIGILDPHHIMGKSTNALRFDLRNGILLTRKEHIYGIHNHDPSIVFEHQEQIAKYLKQREGENIFEILAAQKNFTGADLFTIELALKQELERLRK